MIKDFEFGVEGEFAVMCGVIKVVGVREYDIMVGKGELHLIFIDGENIGDDGSLEFLEKRTHGG